MFPYLIKIQTILLFTVLTFVKGQDRQITSILNPNRGENFDHEQNPLIYIRAEGSEDTIHQLWDFTDNVPAMLFAIGSPNSTLSISWSSSSVPYNFTFSEHPLYSFAAAIDRIIEYDDLKDNGYFDPRSSKIKNHTLDHQSWQLIDSVLTNKEAKVMLRGREVRHNGIIEIELDFLPYKDYATDLPHLIHTSNSTLVDVRLINHTESAGFNSSRFALHFVMVSSDPKVDSWKMNMRKSMDDEHTPGVFEIIEVTSPKSGSTGNGGFMQFRPVAYTEPERGVSSSTNAYISNFNRTSLPRYSLIPKFYREYFEWRDIVVQDMVISFGISGDGFYKQHNFTAWSFTIGSGTPPLEGFSLFVVVIISIGLGVPVVLALSGITYVLVRRYKQRNTPTRFTNDE